MVARHRAPIGGGAERAHAGGRGGRPGPDGRHLPVTARGYHAAMFLLRRPTTMPDPADALPGRSTPVAITQPHHVNGASLTPPWPEGTRTAVFGLGCFLCAQTDRKNTHL